MATWSGSRVVVVVASALLTACGASLDAGSGDFGATPGGVKDLRLARALIARGQVPPAAALPVEGMFAEHDLGLTGPPCAEGLCLRGALAVAPGADDEPRGWLQVGLSSTIDPATYRRPATTFIYTVDVSGSMGWGADGASPGELARTLLTALANRLTAADQAAIVTYGTGVETALPVVGGDDRGRLLATIAALHTDGSTNLEAGLVRAYELARSARAAGRDNVRVVLFTDVQPNVGATTPTEFDRLVREGAAGGVGLTVLGLGVGIGAEVLQSMADVRGGNAFTLTSSAEVDAFLADEEPWFAAPIAYGLNVGVTTDGSVAIDEPFGFPAGFAETARLKVESVFLSRRKGALLVSLVGDGLPTLAADLELAYVEPDGTARRATVPLARAGAALDARGHWYGQPTVARTVALALITRAMADAAERYRADPDGAAARLAQGVARLSADVAAVAAEDLPPELELARAMLALIEARAPQGSLYGP